MASSGLISAIQNKNPRNLYLHQKEALDALDKLDKLGSYSTLLVLPTGAGKTYTASTWLLTHVLDKGKKILWMAHRHMLLDQAAESFKNFAYAESSFFHNIPPFNTSFKNLFVGKKKFGVMTNFFCDALWVRG